MEIFVRDAENKIRNGAQFMLTFSDVTFDIDTSF